MTLSNLPFLDLRPGEDGAEVRDAIARVLARGWFVLGPEVEAFEREFAEASGARHAVGVGNGTDAIALLLRAAGIGHGDEVLVPALTAGFTALAVLQAGASPVIVDVDPGTLTLDPRACEACMTPRVKALVPVHLYGHPADLDGLHSFARRHSLFLVEDCCQAHLATSNGAPVGTRGVGGAFSFYPTKNLGALGDGGAVITDDADVADRVRTLRNGGQRERHHHETAGVNSRLDELQAAILRARLARLPGWTSHRRALAQTYRRLLPATVQPLPERDPGHVYHLFAVRSRERTSLQQHLRNVGIETLVHYPVSLADQKAFVPCTPRPCPVATAAANEVLSLPLHPGLTESDVQRVADAIASFQPSGRRS